MRYSYTSTIWWAKIVVVISIVLMLSAAVNAQSTQSLEQLPDRREIESARDRRTLFGVPLNPGSRFGQAWFPETLRAPEMDLEYSEMRLDWFHSDAPDHHFDEVKTELEQSFNSLTLEVELPLVHERIGADLEDDEESDAGTHTGLSRLEIGTRIPFYQWVSPDETIDYTVLFAFELALPTDSDFTRDTEISPRIYQLLRMGEHFSIQGSVAFAALVGPDEGGSNAIEYAATFGYSLEQENLAIPGIVQLIPIVEITGESGFTGDASREHPLFGDVGVRVNTVAISNFFQPRIAFGYEFPLNSQAREQSHWGVLFSVVFEL